MGTTAQWRRVKRISELQHRSIKIAKYEKQRENRLEKKMSRTSGTVKDLTCHQSPKNRKERG